MEAKSLASKIKTIARKELKPENLDKLDRFRAFYFQGIELKPHEKEELNKLRAAWSFYNNLPSKQATVDWIMKNYILSESHSYLVLRDSIKLFGDVIKTDKQGERLASYEFYMKIADAAYKAQEYDVARKCRENADKIIGLQQEDVNLPDAKDMMPPLVIQFSDDIEVLKAKLRQVDNVIDIPHSEA